jgi:7,8-dihydropterin-6-yl-methyl-4-(beta-D-ribofuranosyl)aminobenzene 5'-phosphate synthase
MNRIMMTVVTFLLAIAVGHAGTKLTVLVENHVCDLPGLKAENGFCILIEKNGSSYLYDTGRSGVCVQNAVVMGKDITKVSKIFLSHGHLDHTGGLAKTLAAIGHPVEIVAHPDVFGKKVMGRMFPIGIPFTEKELKDNFKVTFNFQKGFSKVADGIWLTGEVPMLNDKETIPAQAKVEINGRLERDLIPDDNSLVIETGKGLVVVMGCGHRGVINILSYIKKTLNKPVHAIIGGMHMESADPEHVKFVEKELQTFIHHDHTQVLAPCHCTGEHEVTELKNDFPEIFIDTHGGTTFEFP